MTSELWKALKKKGVSLTQVERRLGASKGWMFDRKRGARFDVGDFFAVLQVAGIEPHKFLAEVIPPEQPGKHDGRSDEPDSILDHAQKIWEEA
jgi:hypothetical protein